MTYASADARQSLLDNIAAAADRIGTALAVLGTVYEQLDDATADRLEDELFRPVQHAYGVAKRTHTEFSARHGRPPRTFPTAPGGLPSVGVRQLLERALAEIVTADAELADLQDTMLPVEVGDPQLRAGLAEVRTLLGTLQARARDLVRTFGR
jgi:hypothetical protein